MAEDLSKKSVKSKSNIIHSSNSFSSSAGSEKIFESIYLNFTNYLMISDNNSSCISRDNSLDSKNDKEETELNNSENENDLTLPDKRLDDQKNFVEAYINTISDYIESSQESTLQGLNISIRKYTEMLLKRIKVENILTKECSFLPLKSCSEILINIINKNFSKNLNFDFETNRENSVKITKDLRLMSILAKEKISNFFGFSVKNGMTILVHGFSNIVLFSLVTAKQKGINFQVLITEARPENSGEIMGKKLKEAGIDYKIILDISVGLFIMDVDAILVGADAVCENGGIINRIGTFTIACCAKRFKKPFYCMVESLRFLKIYPLNISDVPENTCLDFKNKENDLDYKFGQCDFTPPEFITFLFTDIGIFTPSAVSDELIQMFYN